MQRTTLNENDHNLKRKLRKCSLTKINSIKQITRKNASSTNGPPQNKNGLMLKDVEKTPQQYIDF